LITELIVIYQARFFTNLSILANKISYLLFYIIDNFNSEQLFK